MNIYNIYKGGLHQDRLNRIILNFIFIAIYYIKIMHTATMSCWI